MKKVIVYIIVICAIILQNNNLNAENLKIIPKKKTIFNSRD
jgi:hypothetical protein